MLKLSLIIPVYNEERHMRQCLDAVAALRTAPYEVIVVDNNCSDRTIEMARQYDFVRVIEEHRQGRGHARSAGFDAATGDVLGRIDADARVAPNWTDQVLNTFDAYPQLDGVTGLASSAFLPVISFVRSKLLIRSYFWFVHAQFNTVTMWGANMAIRRSAWLRVRTEVCMDDALVHEDQDLSLCIVGSGGLIGVNNKLIVTINGQSYRYLPKLLHYTALFKKTYNRHKSLGNLDGSSFHALGFWRTLPGRIYSTPINAYVGLVAIILFPVDYIVHRFWPKSWWFS